MFSFINVYSLGTVHLLSLAFLFTTVNDKMCNIQGVPHHFVLFIALNCDFRD